VAAGLLAYLILLAFKKNRPGLIVEGFVFGGITALGEAVNYPGGTLIHLFSGVLPLSGKL